MRLGCIFIALAKMLSTSASSSTDRRTQNERFLKCRQVVGVLDRDEALVDRDELEQGVQQRGLARRPVAEDEQRAAVGDVACQAGRLRRRHGAALDQAAQGGRHRAGGAELVGVHRRGGRRESVAAARQIRRVGRHLRLEQHAQRVEVLARLFAERLRPELVDHLVEHGDDVALEARHDGVSGAALLAVVGALARRDDVGVGHAVGPSPGTTPARRPIGRLTADDKTG